MYASMLAVAQIGWPVRGRRAWVAMNRTPDGDPRDVRLRGHTGMARARTASYKQF